MHSVKISNKSDEEQGGNNMAQEWYKSRVSNQQ